mmetsp:Transcript_46943/g.98487  ORF Transcript_46943/g.98487 Transcript_46943/m.98487 type:complete len:84 (-) Transcript_46943:165-416(-)
MFASSCFELDFKFVKKNSNEKNFLNAAGRLTFFAAFQLQALIPFDYEILKRIVYRSSSSCLGSQHCPSRMPQCMFGSWSMWAS